MQKEIKSLSNDINGVLLMNIGTPSAPTTTAIRSFLKEFLSDPDVVDTNPVLRWLIVNCIVAPFRPRKVLPQYQSIWTEDGSPLLVNSERFKVALQNKTPDIRFELGMRYGYPSIESGINKLLDAGVTNLLLCPMFPQYAQATTGSCLDKARDILQKKEIRYETIESFYKEPFFIESIVEQIKNSPNYHNAELLLFSFHGLPERQIKKLDSSGSYCLVSDQCCEKKSAFNEKCYRFQSLETVKKIVMQLSTDKKSQLCFQSRFGMDKWIQPDILEVLSQSAHQGTNNILVVCPAFVADCLETLEEISIRDQEYFTSVGGGNLDLVPSLNTSQTWVSGFSEFLMRKLK